MTDHYGHAPAIEYHSGKALMQHGSEALHDHLWARVEVALGKSLPQMEVRVAKLNLSADVFVANQRAASEELPTLVNTVKKSLRKLSSSKHRATKHILKNVSGVFTPGSITLLLGQPGSGKSALMKVLSGRFPMAKNVRLDGDVTYNGATREELATRLPQYVSYVRQRDYHFPTLTVKETLEFAHECCGGELSERAERHFNDGTPDENKQALEAAHALFRHYPDVAIEQLGLANCQSTIVGNRMLRGVSGDERKRVTTGEMQLGNKFVTFMDEISTGLDSAATFDIIKTQRSVAKKLRKTVVIALLQPAPEVFALFDDVMIMNDGYVMYHGPRDQVLPYFEDLGFRCPPRRDAADFLMDLGTRQQHNAVKDKEDHFDAIPEFHQSFLDSTWTLMARQSKVTLRNKAFLKGRALMVVLIAVVYAMLFLQFDVTDAQVVMGVLFQSILFLALGQTSQIPTFTAARHFYKQRAANFYRTSSYVLACSAAQLPLAVAESIVFGSMVYWVCGFYSSFGGYLLFELLLFLTNLAFAACFFMLAAIAPDLHIAKPLSMVAVMFFVTFAGFIIPRSQSPETVRLSEDDHHAKQVEEDGGGSNTGSEYGLVETPCGDQLELAVAPAPRAQLLFVPVTLAFRDLWYSVPNPANPKEDLELLKGVSGFAEPGTITALMGSSGACKTTLMDVIAGRKSGGKIRGQILLNGHEASELSCTGYCEQMDVHSEASTIREALTFSAFLRQDAGIPDAHKYESVEEVLDLLDLRPIADKIIRGSSVEQMKRLTIGVELAALPSVLFLDEPTSGLDVRSAKVIMDGVRKVADTGRTVVCTIHQPSLEVFQVFDSLLLLKRGGDAVYFGEVGENSSELVGYFEKVEGTPRLAKGYNPATWMLEVIGAGVGSHTTQQHDFVEIFAASEQKRALEARLDCEGFARPTPGVDALIFTKKRAATEVVQAKFLIKRFADIYWRTPSYNLTRFFVYLVLALVFGLAFLDADYDTYQGINAGEGMVFMTSLFLGVVSFNSVLPLSSDERASFYRERAAQTYNAFWYFMGATLAEIPYVFGSTLLYTVIFYPMVGFTGFTQFVFYWIVSALGVLLQTYIGQLLAYAMPSVEVAAIIGVMVNSVFYMFMGFNPPADAIPKGYKWLYYITPHRYGLAIVSALVFGDCDDPADTSHLACHKVRNLPPSLPQDLTIKQYIESVFLMKHSEIWMNFGILLAFIVLARAMAAYALRYINHQKR